MSIRVRVALLVVIASLPGLAIHFYNEYDLRQVREAQVHAEVQREAQGLNDELYRIIEGARNMLTAMAYAPIVRGLDWAACNRYLPALHTVYPGYSGIFVVDRDVRIVCASDAEWIGRELADRAYVREAMETGAFAVGTAVVGRASGIPVIPMIQPVLDDGGRIVAGAVVALRLDWLSTELGPAVVSPGDIYFIADHEGTILAQWPGSGPWTGRTLPEAIKPYVAAEAPGTFELLWPDGVRRIVGYVPATLPPKGTFVVAAREAGSVFRPVTQAMLRGLIVSGAAAVLALAGILIGAWYFFERPVRRLIEVADALRQGQYAGAAAVPRDKTEFGRVGSALVAMAEALSTRETALRESEARLSTAITGAGLATWTLDTSTWTGVGDARLAAMAGLPPERTELPVQEWQAFLHPEDRGRLVADIVAGIAGTGPFTSECRIIRTDGEERWLAVQGGVLRHADGTPFRAVGVIQDITERKRAEVALRRSEAEHRAIFEMLGASHALTDPATSRFLRVNRALCEMTGYSAEELRALTVDDLTHPEDRAKDLAARRRLASGEDAIYQQEKRYVRRRGAIIWVRVMAVLLRDDQGQPVHTVSFIEEITERKRAEERLKLLAAEVDHRAKNILALVQVMLRQTRAGTVKEYAAAASGRVAALARAHTLLSESQWEGANLERLAKEELAPFRRGDGERIRIVGPQVTLSPVAAQSFAMALHELATNAVKHGALSTGAGNVSLEWEWRDGQFVLRWIETGGPHVRAPSHKGLGTNVIERSIGEQLEGLVRFDWKPEGLECELIVPSNKLGMVG
jgi:PAS domain S-box-containing protein